MRRQWQLVAGIAIALLSLVISSPSRAGSTLLLRLSARLYSLRSPSPPACFPPLLLRGGQGEAGSDQVADLVRRGKKAMAGAMFSEAADLFSAALQMKVEQHGEMSIRCAENYFLYGSALALEAEQDDGENLFGPKVPKHIALKGEEEEEEEGEEGDEEDGEEKHEEGNEENREGKIEEAGAGVEEQAKVEEEVQEQVTEGFKEAQADGAIASVDNATTRSNVTEDEETNDPRTQAWEILETARLILQKELLSPTPGDAPVTPAERKSLNLLLADVHLRLGDLNLWNENFEESTWDYSQCLLLRRTLLDPNDKKLMEAEYITGISMLYKGDKQAGLELLREASEVCKVLSSKAEKDGKNYTNILQEIEARIQEEETAGNTTLSEMMEKLKEDEQDPEPFNEDEFEEMQPKRIDPNHHPAVPAAQRNVTSHNVSEAPKVLLSFPLPPAPPPCDDLHAGGKQKANGNGDRG